MQYLKADTATNVLLGPFVAYDDGYTPVTDATLGGGDEASLCKHSGTSFTDLTSDSRTFTHISGGMYYLSLAQGDVDTEGRLDVFIRDDDNFLPVWKEFMVVNANVFDSLFAAATTDYLQVDTTQISSDATAANNLEAALENGTAGYVASDVKYIEGADPTDTLESAVDAGFENAIPAEPTSNSINERIKAIDDKLPSASYLRGTADSDGGLSSTDKADIEAECTDAIEADGLDHLVAASVTGTDITDNSIIAKIVSKDATADWDDFVNTTDALQAIRDNQSGTAATIADAVWDESTTGHTTAGTFGQQCKTDIDDILTDTAVIGALGAGLTGIPWNSSWDAEVQSEVNDALVALKLDHLIAVAESDDPVDNSIIAKMAASDGDWSGFSATTDALEAIADDMPVGYGSGSVTFTYTVYDQDSAALPDCLVWVTSDAAGTTIVAESYSDSNGQCVFYLDDDTTYYFWRRKHGYTFTDPDVESVSA